MKCLEDSLRILWAHKTQRLAQVPIDSRPRAIVIAGPTGCGKTNLSIALAQLLGGEIISADSMQVYRGMDLGTAKPTPYQQELIPHHLIDICEVRHIYNVARFVNDAKDAILSAFSRNRVPIVVGGTGFYISSLLQGAPQAPPSDPGVRAQLLAQWEKFGPDIAFAYLKKNDPDYAAKITRSDKHKIIRALEVLALCQRPLSSFPWPIRQKSNAESIDFHCFFIHRPRPLLYKSIEKRCDEMLSSGLIDEVRSLLGQGLLENSSACQAIGYRQTVQYLRTNGDQSNLKHLAEELKKATRHYAKRQFTWFRRCSDFQWLDVEKLTDEIVVEIIAGDYNLHFQG